MWGPTSGDVLTSFKKKLQARDANQEQLEANLRGRMTELEEKVEEQNIEAASGVQPP
jgi:hypothetical protein